MRNFISLFSIEIIYGAVTIHIADCTNFISIDCQVKCNKIKEKIYKALRGEYESQGVYEDDY